MIDIGEQSRVRERVYYNSPSVLQANIKRDGRNGLVGCRRDERIRETAESYEAIKKRVRSLTPPPPAYNSSVVQTRRIESVNTARVY